VFIVQYRFITHLPRGGSRICQWGAQTMVSAWSVSLKWGSGGSPLKLKAFHLFSYKRAKSLGGTAARSAHTWVRQCICHISLFDVFYL